MNFFVYISLSLAMLFTSRLLIFLWRDVRRIEEHIPPDKATVDYMHPDERVHVGNFFFHFANLRTLSEHEELAREALNHLGLGQSEWKSKSRDQKKKQKNVVFK
ncbi:hypothetical protein A0126_05685 [Exiguobacterium sp. N4-1P]|nr:hypothetical protein A0126_05685 [Exiguobacterium sp. N4-1P]